MDYCNSLAYLYILLSFLMELEGSECVDSVAQVDLHMQSVCGLSSLTHILAFVEFLLVVATTINCSSYILLFHRD